ASVGGGGARLKVRAFDEDHRRLAAFEALGFHEAEPEGVDFRMDLTGDLPEAALPGGVSLRDSVGVDPEARAATHRAAWNHLEHLGIEARSSFTAAAYEAIRAMPVYDPTLDMLAVAPDGALVANCIAWADEASGVGVFEPVGVARAWRGRRIARAIMLEAARGMKARGLRDARVGTTPFNAAAIAAYLAAGFAPAGGFHWWARDLAELGAPDAFDG
ncbi:MAG: GNAT family N-acetyltransferase, partial [Solirubrobacteraceae bacterium]